MQKVKYSKGTVDFLNLKLLTLSYEAEVQIKQKYYLFTTDKPYGRIYRIYSSLDIFLKESAKQGNIKKKNDYVNCRGFQLGI